MSEKTKSYDLNISEKTFEQIYSKADILYFLVSVEGMISSCNATALEVLDYEKKAMTGKKFLELVSDPYDDVVKKAITDCKKKGYLRDVEASLIRKDGHCIHVALNGLSVTDESGNISGIRLYIKNISELVRIKELLRLSVRIFELINDNISFVKLLESALLEIQKTMTVDGIGLFLEETTGKKLILGKWDKTKSISENGSDDFRKWSIDVWNQIVSECSQQPMCYCSPNGSVLIDSLSNQLMQMASGDEKEYLVSLADYETIAIIHLQATQFKHGCLVMTHTVADRLCLNDIVFIESILPAVLAKANKPSNITKAVSTVKFDSLNSLLNISTFGILFTKDGIIQTVNSWVENFLELSCDLINGRPITDFIASEYHERITQCLDLNRSEKAPEQTEEVMAITKDGRRRWIESNLIDFDTNNEMAVWCWISKEERERLHEQLIQARKMESLGILAGGIVHDFNNLLASILGHSSLLCEDVSSDSPFYDDIQQIMRTSEKATELTSRLLAYAQDGSSTTNYLDLNQLVKEVAGILSRTLSKTITIRAELNSELASIKGDASQIQHAILEVTLNARDAIPNGGKIVFRTGNIQLNENDVRLRAGAKPGQYVQLTVSDSGVGINNEIKEQIFEPYFTTKSKDVGRGLGLSIVQEIIERHGGFISVFSELNKGTVFKIHLPVCEKKAKQKRIVPAMDMKPTLGKETILLVDDEKVLKNTARKMLTRYGYKVICAESGTEAIAIYKKYKKRINLVILDLMMPGMETSKILAWLKKLNPNVKVIASTGLNDQDVIEQSIRENIVGYIQKPFQVRPLLQQIRTVLNA